MIEMLEACVLFFGGLGLGILMWAMRSKLDSEENTEYDWEEMEKLKQEIVGIVSMMKDNGMEEFELSDRGFKIKRWLR